MRPRFGGFRMSAFSSCPILAVGTDPDPYVDIKEIVGSSYETGLIEVASHKVLSVMVHGIMRPFDRQSSSIIEGLSDLKQAALRLEATLPMWYAYKTISLIK